VADPVHYIEDHWIWFASGGGLLVLLCCLLCLCSPRLAAGRGGGAAAAGRAPGLPKRGLRGKRGNRNEA